MEGDPTVPEGWQVAYRNCDTFGVKTKRKVFWSPAGIFCASRREALVHLVHDLNSPKTQVHSIVSLDGL